MTLLQENKNIVSSRAKSRDISHAITNTLKYSDHFGFPLTLPELYTRLIQSSCTKSQLTKSLSALVNQRKLEKTGGYYYLPGRSELVARRQHNFHHSQHPLSKARVLATKLGHIPGVLAIYLTGSLAMSNSGSDSDIDFMIITKNGQLWTTRFLLTLYTTILGLRRTPHSKTHSAKLCLNLYLSPASYLLPPQKRSLYTAYELIQAVPLYDPTNTQSNLLSANDWIHDYLPNFALPKSISRLTRENGKTGLLEHVLYSIQRMYMKSKITREYVTRDSAFFHPSDPGRKILNKLQLE